MNFELMPVLKLFALYVVQTYHPDQERDTGLLEKNVLEGDILDIEKACTLWIMDLKPARILFIKGI